MRKHRADRALALNASHHAYEEIKADYEFGDKDSAAAMSKILYA